MVGLLASTIGVDRTEDVEPLLAPTRLGAAIISTAAQLGSRSTTYASGLGAAARFLYRNLRSSRTLSRNRISPSVVSSSIVSDKGRGYMVRIVGYDSVNELSCLFFVVHDCWWERDAGFFTSPKGELRLPLR
jgi:hypothetical protein